MSQFGQLVRPHFVHFVVAIQFEKFAIMAGQTKLHLSVSCVSKSVLHCGVKPSAFFFPPLNELEPQQRPLVFCQ